MNLSQQLQVMQIMDSSFPTGSFAQSWGLETAIQAGSIRTAQDLRDWIKGWMTGSLGPSDGVAAMSAWVYSGQENLESIKALDERLHASRPAKESREGAARVGKRTLQAVLELYDSAYLQRYQTEVQAGTCSGQASIVHGIWGRACGLTMEETIAASLWAATLPLVANAVRAVPLGQSDGQRVLAALRAEIESMATACLAVPIGDIRSFAPLADVAAMGHEYLYSRLFMS